MVRVYKFRSLENGEFFKMRGKVKEFVDAYSCSTYFMKNKLEEKGYMIACEEVKMTFVFVNKVSGEVYEENGEVKEFDSAFSAVFYGIEKKLDDEFSLVCNETDERSKEICHKILTHAYNYYAAR